MNSQSQITADKNFDPRLVKSKDMKPVDMEVQQHIHLKIATCKCGDLVTKSRMTLVIPWTVTCQAPLSEGFSTQEYWSRLLFGPGQFKFVLFKGKVYMLKYVQIFKTLC